MLARIILDLNDQYKILCANGDIAPLSKSLKMTFLSSAKMPQLIIPETPEGKWDTDSKDMAVYPGRTIAFISDDKKIVIDDFSPFSTLFFPQLDNESDYISSKEFAEKYNVSFPMVKYLLQNDKIVGAVKDEGRWKIPADAPYPVSRRKSKGFEK